MINLNNSTTLIGAWHIYRVMGCYFKTMKDRINFINYGKGVLSFGKHKGKTIKEIIISEDYGYVVWLRGNVKRITISDSDYDYCKKMVDNDNAMHEAIMESRHGNHGCRD